MSFSKCFLACIASITDRQPRKGRQLLLVLILICICNIAALPFFFKVLILNCSNDKLSIRKLLLAGRQIPDVLFEVPVWHVSSEEKTRESVFNNITLWDYVSIQ